MHVQHYVLSSSGRIIFMLLNRSTPHLTLAEVVFEAQRCRLKSTHWSTARTGDPLACSAEQLVRPTELCCNGHAAKGASVAKRKSELAWQGRYIFTDIGRQTMAGNMQTETWKSGLQACSTKNTKRQTRASAGSQKPNATGMTQSQGVNQATELVRPRCVVFDGRDRVVGSVLGSG